MSLWLLSKPGEHGIDCSAWSKSIAIGVIERLALAHSPPGSNLTCAAGLVKTVAFNSQGADFREGSL